MPTIWVETADPENVDLETIAANRNTIKVNDVRDPEEEEASQAGTFINTGTLANDRALKVTGKTEMVGELAVNGSIIISGPEQGLYTENNDTLHVGSTETTGLVIIGNADEGARILGDVVITGTLKVGEGVAPASIDTGGDPDPLNLNIGAGASTADVTLSRAGKDVNVADDLNVGGDLKVGPDDGGGFIDSGGTVVSPQHLKIGTSTDTEDVLIGRANQTVEMMAQARLNSNGIVMNDAASVNDVPTAGCGMIFNDAGHGNGDSIDFYTGGTLRGWLDSTGFVVNV